MKKRVDFSLKKSGFTDKAPEDSKFNFLNGQPYSQRYFKILKTRKKLPAWEAKEQFLKLMKKHQILVLQGETGSGKTTQIPQFLVEAGYANKR